MVLEEVRYGKAVEGLNYPNVERRSSSSRYEFLERGPRFWIFRDMYEHLELQVNQFKPWQVNYRKAGSVMLRIVNGEVEMLVAHKRKGGLDEEGSFMTSKGLIPGGCLRIGDNIRQALEREVLEELVGDTPENLTKLSECWEQFPPVYLGNVRDRAEQDIEEEIKVVEISLFLIRLCEEPLPHQEIELVRWVKLQDIECDENISTLIRFNAVLQIRKYLRQLLLMNKNWPEQLPTA